MKKIGDVIEKVSLSDVLFYGSAAAFGLRCGEGRYDSAFIYLCIGIYMIVKSKGE